MRPSGECACGQRAERLCRDCALAYCADCCTRRHAKGAFQHHTVVAIASSSTSTYNNNSCDNNCDGDDDVQPPSTSTVCDECGAAAAELRCDACELRFCARCSALVHRNGALQSHTAFVALGDEKSAPAVVVGAGDAKPTPSDASTGLKAEMIRAGEATETPLDDASQEAALNSATDAEAYDLWSSWSVRSFSERSSSIDSTSQWRSLRSLSIDSKASSTNVGDDDLPLSSISKSLQSLAFSTSAPPPEDETKVDASPIMFAQRPRSFSDYTSLRSHTALGSSGSGGGDLWRETPPAMGSSSSILELWKAMKTKFPSRHVLVKSATGAFDATDVQRISEHLSSFGGVAKLRDEFALDGLLFFTYFELKSAIGAVTGWFSSISSSSSSSSGTMALSSHSPGTASSFSASRPFSGGEVADYCLPYEAPDDVNCATLLVRLNGPPVSSTEMRQFCSRFGEVASVLQHDVSASKYILEFNDARDVQRAISGLAAAFHPNGTISAVRTSPPTQDMAKIQLFQEHLDNAVAVRRSNVVDLGARIPSFSSSSTTSMLTPSPTSTSSSPLNASFLEPPHDDASVGVGFDLTDGSTAQGVRRATSPFDGGGFQMRSSTSALPDDPIWSGSSSSSTLRPRSSSSSFIGLGSVKADASRYTPEPAQFSNPYSPAVAAAAAAAASAGTVTFPPYMSSHFAQQLHQQQQQQHHQSGQMMHRGGGSHFYQQHLQQRLMGSSGAVSKYGTPRTGSDPGFRSAFANGPSHGTGGHSSGGGSASSGYQQHTVTGRNDQGVGEFCLSIDRVASGADKRTTLMIRNIPNKYTQQMLLAEINAHHRGKYDFFYLPIDFKNKCNMGYAFINFMEAESIIPFYKEFDSQKWTNFNSEKVCAISYARLQGKQAMITRFQNSSLLEKHESYRPLVFTSSGVNRGKPETFPAPKQPPHHKKQLVHHPHHNLVMGGGSTGGADVFGGSLAQSRLYIQNQQQQQQLQQMQQMQQAMHHAHQMMAGQLAHNALHGISLAPHLSYHHQFQPQEQHAMNFHQQQQQQHQYLQYQSPDHHLHLDGSGAVGKAIEFGQVSSRTADLSP